MIIGSIAAPIPNLDTRWRWVGGYLNATTALHPGEQPPAPPHWRGFRMGFRPSLNSVRRKMTPSLTILVVQFVA